jgi:hypothetical protein
MEANTPEAEQYKFNLWDGDIRGYVEKGDFRGLKGYIQSKSEVEDRDFFIYLISNIGHYGYSFNKEKYEGFLSVVNESLYNLGVIK